MSVYMNFLICCFDESKKSRPQPEHETPRMTTQTFRPVFTHETTVDKISATHVNTASLGRWASFPSHTYHVRNGPARIRDDVRTRDFQHEFDLRIEEENELDPREGRKLKLRETILLRLKRVSRTTSLELRNKMMAGGHRSSIGAGRSLEYPELEVLPGEGAMR